MGESLIVVVGVFLAGILLALALVLVGIRLGRNQAPPSSPPPARDPARIPRPVRPPVVQKRDPVEDDDVVDREIERIAQRAQRELKMNPAKAREFATEVAIKGRRTLQQISTHRSPSE